MKKVLLSIQWMAFIILSNVVYALAIGPMFHLTEIQTIAFLQRTIFILGVGALIQLFFGHKIYISEVPSGLWVGLMVIYAGIGQALFGSDVNTIRVISFAIIATGIIIILLSIFGLLEKLMIIFTPPVLSTFLFLVVGELSKDFIEGMFGIGYNGRSEISIPIALVSIGIVILSLIIRKFKKFAPISFIIVIGMGWLAFYILGLPIDKMPHIHSLFNLPKAFPFGMPIISMSMIPSIIIAVFVLLSTMIASTNIIKIMLEKANNKTYDVSLKKGGVALGINQVIAGIFFSVAAIPGVVVAGFIEQTGSTRRTPFLIGNILVIIISLVTPIMAFFGTLPTPVAYASIFTVFASLFGNAIKELDKLQNKSKILFSIGIPIFAGYGIMYLPNSAFTGLPTGLSSFLSNGLVVGITLAIIIEIYNLIFNK
ncbi:MAG: purine/pyrimidine permease [Clostridium sp.]